MMKCDKFNFYSQYGFVKSVSSSANWAAQKVRPCRVPLRYKFALGNIVIHSDTAGLQTRIAGFENHAGRTYIGGHTPLGTVTCGFGNNAEDGKEGVLYKNIVGTYLHGPVFPKNPKLADYVIQKALNRKYNGDALLSELDDYEENRGNAYVVNRFSKKRRKAL